MEYVENRERSAEYLRKAIALMSQHEATFSPNTYALWYEYVSGRTPGLNRELDALVDASHKVDEATADELYRRHIAPPDEQKLTRVNVAFQRLLAELAESTSGTGEQATHFSSRLQELSRKLGTSQSAPLLHQRLDELLQDTQGMKASVDTLKQRLDASQGEIEALRLELTRVHQEVVTDALTGLLNRRAFDAAISAAAADPVALCLLMVDIDHFKRINDKMGHVFGDRVIRTISALLKEAVKGQDTVFRYGGEEFAVLLPDTSIEGAGSVAERLRSAVQRCRIRRSDSEQVILTIEISVGVACYDVGESVISFIERADKALYRSKANGRNRVTVAKS